MCCTVDHELEESRSKRVIRFFRAEVLRRSVPDDLEPFEDGDAVSGFVGHRDSLSLGSRVRLLRRVQWRHDHETAPSDEERVFDDEQAAHAFCIQGGCYGA